MYRQGESATSRFSRHWPEAIFVALCLAITAFWTIRLVTSGTFGSNAGVERRENFARLQAWLDQHRERFGKVAIVTESSGELTVEGTVPTWKDHDLLRVEIRRIFDKHSDPYTQVQVEEWKDPRYLKHRREYKMAAATLPLRCPCCRCRTLTERGAFDICPVCFWEDDGQDDRDADVVRGGPNGGLSLTVARMNYSQFGACEERFQGNVRKPTAEELPD